MRIDILKNRETSLVIDDVGKAIAENSILKDGYEKAIHALERYLKQTEVIWEKLVSAERSDSQINDILYQSPQNIIAFSGKRGTGKTSAMISFSEFVKHQGETTEESRSIWNKHFPGLQSLVLSPIDPTMLENDQDILSVVLSRLLYKAEERWNRNNDFHRGAQYLENDKNALLKKASACMNGIQAVKRKGEIKSLEILQRVGDSAVLKKNLFDLVNLVNVFCLSVGGLGSNWPLLVIPIDDTDCQIRKAHEVMEDIRRYLTLPNVIILMATDSDMLRDVFAQHYATEFEKGINRGFLETADMEHYAEKYLTKLIPGTQKVYLPVFENVLQGNSVKLELGYYDDESKDLDLISGTTRSDRDKNRGREYDIDFDFQSKILTFIYRRTGLVFSEHEAYINNIIPTTMRGVAHLLNYLYSMKTVEKIVYSHEYSSQELIGKVQDRLAALEWNLDLFEEYFMNEWVPAKVSGEMVKILRGIQEQVPENLIRYAFDEMFDKYIDNKDNANTYFSRKEGESYYRLMEMLGAINGSLEEIELPKTFKHRSDFYNTFAVRTLLSIKNNKQALKIRFKAIEEFNKKAHDDPSEYIDYSACIINNSLPHETDKDGESGPYVQKVKPVVELYRELLQDSIEVQNEQKLTEKHCMQELSWIVLCNWEVQDIIYKSVNRYLQNKKNTEGTEGEKSAEELWKHIQDDMAAKNCKMLQFIAEKGAVQISGDDWSENFNKILTIDDRKPEDDSGKKESTNLVSIKERAERIKSTLKKEKNARMVRNHLEEMLQSLQDKKSEVSEQADLLGKKESADWKEVIEDFDKHIVKGKSLHQEVNSQLNSKGSEEEGGDAAQETPIDDTIKRKIYSWLPKVRRTDEKADELLLKEKDNSSGE